MPKSKDNIDITPPEHDPFMDLKQLIQYIDKRQTDLEEQMVNLQTAWDRILHVAQEEPLAPLQQRVIPRYQQSQPVITPQELPQQQPVTPVDNKPKWEEEPAKPKKRKLGRGAILVIIALALIALVFMYLMSKGYTFHL